MLPNPSLALQASMAREVSFPNGASTSGGGTDLKLELFVAGCRSQETGTLSREASFSSNSRTVSTQEMHKDR